MKFLFTFAYCALLATVAAQTSTTLPPKESENCSILGQIVLQPGGQPLKKAPMTKKILTLR